MAEPPDDILDLMELKFLLMAPQDSLRCVWDGLGDLGGSDCMTDSLRFLHSTMDQTMFLVEHAYWYYEVSHRLVLLRLYHSSLRLHDES